MKTSREYFPSVLVNIHNKKSLPLVHPYLISPPVYSGFGMISFPSSSFAGRMRVVARSMTMANQTNWSAKCMPGQILKMSTNEDVWSFKTNMRSYWTSVEYTSPPPMPKDVCCRIQRQFTVLWRKLEWGRTQESFGIESLRIRVQTFVSHDLPVVHSRGGKNTNLYTHHVFAITIAFWENSIQCQVDAFQQIANT